MLWQFSPFYHSPFYRNFDGLIGTKSIEIRFDGFVFLTHPHQINSWCILYIDALQHAIAKLMTTFRGFSFSDFIYRNVQISQVFLMFNIHIVWDYVDILRVLNGFLLYALLIASVSLSVYPNITKRYTEYRLNCIWKRNQRGFDFAVAERGEHKRARQH